MSIISKCNKIFFLWTNLFVWLRVLFLSIRNWLLGVKSHLKIFWVSDLFSLNMIMDFKYFFVINSNTHNRLSCICFLSFFFKQFIKIIYGYNFFVHGLSLVKICQNLFILQFLGRVALFQVFHFYHFFSCEFIVLFMLKLLKTV